MSTLNSNSNSSRSNNNQSNRLRHQAGLRSGTPGEDGAAQTHDDDDDDDPNGKDSRLKTKISMLRDVSITIGDEIRDQNKFLATMGEDMDGLGGRLATTMKHFYDMWARQGCGPLFYLCLFAACVFVFMYLYLKFR
ncbi:protein transport protein bet1 [Coemansia sp. RSA 2050]|nr:protein transport protein bet1 [Coemansia sp. RSA 2050]KAJ2732533.1 protein transport protein bet1 [Coemansia sp. BCRC 34962]